MNKEKFNEYVHTQLMNGDKKVVYGKVVGDVYYGYFCDTMQEAFDAVLKFYEENPDVRIFIADYTAAPCLWNKRDILLELGMLEE